MTTHDAIIEVNAAMDRLRTVRDTLANQLVEKRCQSGETRQISELHYRVAQAIAAYKRGK